MTPEKHQVRAAKELKEVLLKYGIAILAGEVRSGKTLSYIECCKLLNLKTVLIITKLNAIDGNKNTSIFYPDIDFTIVNYEQVKNLPKDYDPDLVILDEFHAKISNAEPKGVKKALWKSIHPYTYLTPCIFTSGTPTPEGYASIYNPLALSCKSPFSKYSSFTKWYQDYGTFEQTVIGYNYQKKEPIKRTNWKSAKTDKIKKALEHIIVTITQKEAGHKYFAKDNLIKIPLSRRQESYYNRLKKDKLIELPNDYSIVCDKTNLNQKLHQIAGGFCKTVYDYNENITSLKKFINIPKVEYIKKNYDSNNTVIFCFFIAEQEYLSTLFPHVYSITKYAEGTDFSDFDKVVIYSFSHRAVIYQQIRARQMNFKKRKKEIVIDFLISGIDELIYQAVAIEKKNFTASWYNKRSK